MNRRRRGGGDKNTRSEQTLQRRVRHRPEKVPILIVCEGRETEPNYFWGLQRAVRQNFSVVVKEGKGGSCLAVVQQAIAELEKAAARGEDFNEGWCVFDVEQAGQRGQVIKARTLAEQHGIRLALSNPCFEVWLLTHFVRTKKDFADCSKVEKALNKHWSPEFGQDYEKNYEKVYARLESRTETAIDNARNVREQDWAASADIVDCNSATDVYLLVGRLLGPSE
jgi:hypothetical protein